MMRIFLLQMLFTHLKMAVWRKSEKRLKDKKEFLKKETALQPQSQLKTI